ncbi:MAG: hypothetical protein C4538_07885 [Nitrospiraceae bacterium]|nr:MAG: hypothetical protein C4538_07885 [Nitrospiraceae bacterium]
MNIFFVRGSTIFLIVAQLAKIIHRFGASMVREHIVQYLSICNPQTFCLHVYCSGILIIHCVQDVPRTMACSKVKFMNNLCLADMKYRGI